MKLKIIIYKFYWILMMTMKMKNFVFYKKNWIFFVILINILFLYVNVINSIIRDHSLILFKFKILLKLFLYVFILETYILGIKTYNNRKPIGKKKNNIDKIAKHCIPIIQLSF